MSAPATARREYIDWLRGVAVLFMIAWHSIDAWSVMEGRGGAAFSALLFIAGWAAPLFLFLAGVSLSLAGEARLARGMGRASVSSALQRRGWQVFLIAHLFRFQSFLLNVNGSWSSIIKPDILNVLGLGLVAAAFCWSRVRTVRDGAIWLLVPAIIIVVVVTPLSRHWWWPTLLHPRLEAYIRPVSNYGVFSLFPTVAYVFSGAFLGGLIARHPPSDLAFHRALGVIGVAVLALGIALMFVHWPFPVVRGDSLPVFLWRIGAMTSGLAVVWTLFRVRGSSRPSALVTLGQASLPIYWVHVELVYGLFSYPIRHTLPLAWAFFAYLALTWAMLGLAAWWLRRPKYPSIVPEHMAAT